MTSKLTVKDMLALEKHFKALMVQDIMGITATDARHTIVKWLREIGEPRLAESFEKDLIAYLDNPHYLKLEREYNVQA